MSRLGRRRQDGFSLVELMVALTIGLLLLLGVLQILLSNRDSAHAQRATARVQENLRLAEFVLTHSIAHAGFNATPDPTRIDASAPFLFSDSADAPNMLPGQVVSGATDSNGDNDTIRIRYLDRGSVSDCRGTDRGDASDGGMADFEFYVNDDNTLICRVIGGDSQPVVDNVARFEVTYGIDTNGDGSVDEYTSTIPAGDARRVLSVRIQLLLDSGPTDGDSELAHDVKRTFDFAHGPPFTSDDRRVYMFMDETIALRNAL